MADQLTIVESTHELGLVDAVAPLTTNGDALAPRADDHLVENRP